MRRVGLIGLVLALAVPLAAGQQQKSAVSFETLTFANSAAGVGFTATTLVTANGVQVQECSGRLEGGEIRIRTDGTAPTTTVGLLFSVGDWVTITGYTNLSRLLGIRTGTPSGVINFQCYAAP